MTRIALRLSYMFIILLMIAGCWDRQEVDKLAIVIGLGIDVISGPEPFLITAQVVSPSTQKSGQDGGQDNPFVILAQGKTISEAIRNFSKDTPRKMFFAHNNIIVIGEKLAKTGIQDFMDFLDRSPQFRRNAWLMVTPKTAKEVLQSKCDLQKYSAIGMKEMIYERYHPFSNKMQRKDTMSRLEGPSAAALALKVDILDENQLESKKLKEAGNTVQNLDKNSITIMKQLRISGLSVFNKDKFAGYLNDAESQGLLWFLGEHKEYPIRLSCPNSEQKYIVFLLNQTNKKLKPVLDHQQLGMKVEIGNNAIVSENNCPDLSLFNQQDKTKLEQQLNLAVKKQMMQSLDRVKELGTDVVHFADAFYQENPAEWQMLAHSYEKRFSEIQVTVDVKSRIRLTGMTSEAHTRN
ncbi:MULTISPECIES: Ger(x)C family spore germination protein [unclassified Paenibacillus]|uniref:Ger(x)C family spore germination protein n=1 Tax=unclassified Paenibacillus TaxID=185978 RepID=UPI000710154E|nr:MULTISPECIES: Ger(x)C family spore germination protein [unclassified Paenibacillus]KQX64683.1 hypothetical protein ASD40_02550 [Paenibacillus sp. Root444D2]KRE51936.1 hypothetical protein ASG85_02030 [Paenibacillus sp. Soil724D2]